jgi:hypothetical protein
MLDDMSAGADSVTIDPFGLQPGEAAQVGHAVAGALSGNRGFEASAAPAPAADLSGAWELTMSFLHGARRHSLRLKQNDQALAGAQECEMFSGAVDGTVSGNEVRLRLRDRYEGSNITFQLAGTVEAGGMAGTMLLGTSNDHHQGAVNLAQFGSGSWVAKRLG